MLDTYTTEMAQESKNSPRNYGKEMWKTVCMRLTQRTAQIVSTKQEELKQIKWTDGESNTEGGFSRLSCLCVVEAWNEIKEEYPLFRDMTLEARSPDITITFKKETQPITTCKIELKSGKGNTIPGSTIGGLDMNEPVMYCRRDESDGTFHFRYGQYHGCIGESERDLFQDRTPRPHVNYQKMADIDTTVEYVKKEKTNWVGHYAKCALHRITGVVSSWQDHLVKKIITLFIAQTSVEDFAKMKAEQAVQAE